MEDFKTVYILRRSFLANFILFVCALVWSGVSIYNGNHYQFDLSMILFAFHLFMTVLMLGILRFFPNPDLMQVVDKTKD